MKNEELIAKIGLFPAYEASRNPECLFILGQRTKQLSNDDMRTYLHNVESLSQSFSDCILHFKQSSSLIEVEPFVIRNSMFLFDKCIELLWRIETETSDEFNCDICLESDFDGAENLPYNIQEQITPIVSKEVIAMKSCIKMVKETDTSCMVFSEVLKVIFYSAGVLAMEFYLRLEN